MFRWRVQADEHFRAIKALRSEHARHERRIWRELRIVSLGAFICIAIAVIARRWRGHYRVRGRGWEMDTRSRAGWIPTLTNPSFDADGVADAVTRWTRGAVDDPSIGIMPAVAFPRPFSTVVLEEPVGEIVTVDNAPWWAQGIGRVQRLDAQRAARFVEAVLSASEAEAMGDARSATARVA